MDPVSTSRTVRKHEPIAAPAVTSPIAPVREKPHQRWDWEELHQSSGRISWSRYLAALRRYKWLLALVIVAGVGFGFFAARYVKPVYDVHSTIWITPDKQHDERAAPIRGDEVQMHTAAWSELLTSFAILEKVARRLSLYVAPMSPGDSVLFRGFRTAEDFRPGQYELKVDPRGRLYTLSLLKGPRVETGVVGDSIGRTVGFQWAPSAAALGPGRDIRFNLISPRTAALGIRGGLTSSLPEGSNLMRITLTGTSPQGLTTVMRALVDEFVNEAADLKKRNLVEVAKTLQKQLDVAAKDLHDAENALEAFRVRTITLPSETRATAVPAPTTTGARTAGAGDDAVRDPVSESFFAEQLSYDAARRERELLERTMSSVQQGTLDPSALSIVPAARNNPELQSTLKDLADREAKLSAARNEFTDSHPTVQKLAGDVKELREKKIPRAVDALITQLKMQEADLQDRVQGTARELRDVPVRTIEEARLRRNVSTSENLYALLKSRSEEANLAEASAVSDVSVLDAPVVPETPTSNRAPFVIVLSTLVGIVAAGALAFVLDRYDPRFRYPEQATDEMGLDIVGAIPAIKHDEPRAEADAMQLVEAFRTVRLSVAQAADPSGRVLVTISSPNAGDGKSMISANLAQSFAEAGYRTLLIDGDIRRGELDKRFEVPRTPGLLDYVTGAATLEQALHSTTNDKLWLMTRGTQQQRGPELLMSPVVPDLMTELQRRFEAVIVDCSPLGAGIDPFVLGAATGNMLLVLRAGESNRKLAEAKLKLITRLPIRLLGVVLNDVRMSGDFQYYSYSYSDKKEETKLPVLETQIDEFARRSGLISIER
ncbi:MAG TPA: polysaccharide biosynthesis tyrosine autokinase [Gemmatimonadaceae bacterium]|nr:polysaccharide biosynthesis tyrosine autokinase [Gemmatimonadaceae bacterium]